MPWTKFGPNRSPSNRMRGAREDCRYFQAAMGRHRPIRERTVAESEIFSAIGAGESKRKIANIAESRCCGTIQLRIRLGDELAAI